MRVTAPDMTGKRRSSLSFARTLHVSLKRSRLRLKLPGTRLTQSYIIRMTDEKYAFLTYLKKIAFKKHFSSTRFHVHSWLVT